MIIWMYNVTAAQSLELKWKRTWRGTKCSFCLSDPWTHLVCDPVYLVEGHHWQPQHQRQESTWLVPPENNKGVGAGWVKSESVVRTEQFSAWTMCDQLTDLSSSLSHRLTGNQTTVVWGQVCINGWQHCVNYKINMYHFILCVFATTLLWVKKNCSMYYCQLWCGICSATNLTCLMR